MNLQMLAQNVKRMRSAKKISQKDLAVSAGVSLPAIKNLETAKSEPRMQTVLRIAQALRVQVQELFVPVRELQTVRFRSSRRMQNRENVLADVARWLNDFNCLEEILEDRIPYHLEVVQKSSSQKDAVKAALACRRALGLDDSEPIYDICGLLEHAGVKVYSIPMSSDGFFGLSLGVLDGGPAIVVNTWDRISVERRIFSAAHELGHLLLHPAAYDVAEMVEDKEEENEADCFAGYFLMPDAGFRKEWADVAGLPFVDRVFKVKRIFRVSYKTVLFRLRQLGVVDSSIWKRFNGEYLRRFRKSLSFKEEPMAMETYEPLKMEEIDFQEDRFSRLVKKAVEEDKISLSRGAEILRVNLVEMQELLISWKGI